MEAPRSYEEIEDDPDHEPTFLSLHFDVAPDFPAPAPGETLQITDTAVKFRDRFYQYEDTATLGDLCFFHVQEEAEPAPASPDGALLPGLGGLQLEETARLVPPARAAAQRVLLEQRVVVERRCVPSFVLNQPVAGAAAQLVPQVLSDAALAAVERRRE